MFNFISKIVYYLIPLLIGCIVGDFLISKTLKSSKTYASGEYPTWNDLYEGNIDSEIVIYGSSRALVQIDPSVIQDSLQRSCYNLGIDGHNFWMQYFRHAEFLKHNQKPSIIIHSLDVTTLDERGDLFNADQFLPYMWFDETIELSTAPYPVFSFFDFHVPMARYFGNSSAILHALKLLFIKQPDSLGRLKGYKGQSALWNDDLSNAQRKMPYYEVAIDSNALSLFTVYLKECRDQDIKVIFVYSPQYTEGQKFVRNTEAILDVYRKLSKEYKIPFLDYSGDPMCQSKSNFYNSSHLNKRGAEFFTQKLAHDLKLNSYTF